MEQVALTATQGQAMSRDAQPGDQAAATLIWQIRVEGHLGPEWADWFGGFSLEPAGGGETLLSGSVVDQAALHGVLKRIRDLGLPLLALNRVENHPARAMPDREEA